MDLDTIYHTAAESLGSEIPDESIDLIYTDPVYNDFSQYAWVAKTAARVLKPDRPCLVWIYTEYLPQVLEAMTPYLNFRWVLHSQKSGGFYPGPTGITVMVQCLWFDKGHYTPKQKAADWYREGTSRASIPDSYSGHKWAKPLDVIARWLQLYSQVGDLVLDPFTGSGTIPIACKMLGRHFIASEIDPDYHSLAQRRLAGVQLPLAPAVLWGPQSGAML